MKKSEDFLPKFLNQKGVSLPLVIALTSIALSSVGYLVLNLLPRLQDSKSKSEQSMSYRVFVSSLNDYLVHAIRSRWCLAPTGGVIDGMQVTNLLQTSDCTGQGMEHQVQYPTNLERLLWDPGTTIGSENSASAPRTTILGFNYIRRTSGQTTVLLGQNNVIPPIDSVTGYPTIKLKVTNAILNDMTNEHPLYHFSREVSSCINEINIDVARLSNGPILPQGDEVKLKVSIKVDLKTFPLRCASMKKVSSDSFYTLYPRRLNQFALIHYGDLSVAFNHEYLSPVYVAGNLKLNTTSPITGPFTLFRPAKTSIFYDSLTLATYNSGSDGGNEVYPGIILGRDNQPYTFSERGHPTFNKQDSYREFRGILGGLRLEAEEDKGLMNLFNKYNTSSSDIALMEACIEENQIKTTPSYTSDTLLAFKKKGAPANESRFQVAITKKNRFKKSLAAPGVITTDTDLLFKGQLNSISGTEKYITRLDYKINNTETISFNLGQTSPAQISIDYAKYNLVAATLDSFLTNIDSVNQTNYAAAIPATHITSKISQFTDFKTKTEALIAMCTANGAGAPAICSNFGVEGTCTSSCPGTSEVYQYESSKTALKNKITTFKTLLSQPAQMTVALDPLNHSNGKLLINHTDIKFSYNNQWIEFYPLIREFHEISPEIKFSFNNYSPNSFPITFIYDERFGTDVFKLKRQDTAAVVSTSTNWKNSINNENIPSSQPINELYELECPSGMGLADWDLDMSSSSNFAWNYTDLIPGVTADGTGHGNKDPVVFDNGPGTIGHKDNHGSTFTVSVADLCTVKKQRTHIYGFYVCKELVVESGRTAPLHFVGTMITKKIRNTNKNYPVYWNSIWSNAARDLILTNLNANEAICASFDAAPVNVKQTFSNPTIERKATLCGPLDLIENGPNNFSWSTVDPEIGIDPEYPTMTSEKVKRFYRWIVREDSRKDMIL